jgi:heptosyltransferase-2
MSKREKTGQVLSSRDNLVTFAKSAARRTLSLLTSPQASYSVGEPLFGLLGMRRKGREINLSQVKRVLVVRLDEIGDVVVNVLSLCENYYATGTMAL